MRVRAAAVAAWREAATAAVRALLVEAGCVASVATARATATGGPDVEVEAVV